MPYNTTAIPPRKEPTGTTQLPLSRVKKIIGQDPEIGICSNNAAFIITLATEMFIQRLAEESHNQAKLERKPRRNIQYKDVANAVSHHDNLEFLEDVVPKTVPYKKIKASVLATQARVRVDGTVDDRPTTSHSQITNGVAAPATAGRMSLNGDASIFSVRPPPPEARRGGGGDDADEQLQMEMRQAEAGPPPEYDVNMTG